MSMFKMEIRLDNAAFHDDDGDFAPGPEIGSILNKVRHLVEHGSTFGAIRDVNGNLVGEWRIEE